MIQVALALAGGFGAVLRFLVDQAISRRGSTAGMPLGTAVINLTGSFLLGLVTGWWASAGGDPAVKLAIGTGFLGGFTTFSTASVEAARLLRSGRATRGLGYALGTMLASVLLAMLGIWLGQAG